MSQPQQYEDPISEARRDLLQGLSVMSTFGEAAARWMAAGIQKRAAEAARRADREQAARAARRQAAIINAKLRAERHQMAASLDGNWLTDKATFAEAAAAWRSGLPHAAAGDPVAVKVVGLAQDRIRQVHPAFMDAYDRLRADGHSTIAAAHMAARQVWEAEARAYPGSPARPHGNDRAATHLRSTGPALPVGAVDGAGGAAEWDAAVRDQVAGLADGLHPDALLRIQQQLRADGQVPAADAAGLLRRYLLDAAGQGHLQPGLAANVVDDLDARADAERRRAVLAGGAGDDPDTPRVDERGDAQHEARTSHGDAEHDEAGAAQRRRMGQAFRPLSVGQVPADVAARRPAEVVPPRLGRSR